MVAHINNKLHIYIAHLIHAVLFKLLWESEQWTSDYTIGLSRLRAKLPKAVTHLSCFSSYSSNQRHRFFSNCVNKILFNSSSYPRLKLLSNCSLSSQGSWTQKNWPSDQLSRVNPMRLAILKIVANGRQRNNRALVNFRGTPSSRHCCSYQLR